MSPRRGFVTLPLSPPGFPRCTGCPRRGFWASPLARRLAATCGRIALHHSYGPVVHLRLLPTSPRGDAVTFDYGPEKACPERTRTALLTNTLERTSRGVPVRAGPKAQI